MMGEEQVGGRRARWWLVELALACLVLVVAAVPRVRDLDVFLTPDETRWICRSTNFYAALEERDFARTYQKEHPGVITMWLGNLGMPVDGDADYAVACREVPPSKLVSAVPHETLDVIRDRLFAGRLRVALAVSLGIAAMYLVASRLLGRGTALIAALLVALDPFYLAHARVLHLDGLTATLMTLSLLLVLLAARGGARTRLLLLSGICGGLAALNKSPALFMAPMTGVLLAIDGRRAARPWGRVAGEIVVWAAAASATWLLLWPALWTTPVQAIHGILRGAMGYAEDPHEGSNYFWGAIRPDPGPAFYLVAWLLRVSPLALIGVAAAGWRLVRRRLPPVERDVVLALFSFSLLFGLFMTMGAKKFDRYLLPVHPAMDVVAGIGLSAMIPVVATWIGRLRRRPAGVGPAWAVLAAAVALIGAVLVGPHHPYYLSAYNPLLGGARAAKWALLIGWGEGIDRIADHLNAEPDADKLTVATRYRSAFGPLFEGRALEMDDYDPATLDYYLLYVNQIQRNLDPDVVERLANAPQPEAVASFRGIDYAWLYPNDAYKATVAAIEHRARPGDAILVRADSRLARLYAGPLDVVTVDPDASATSLLALLRSAFARHPRLWYVRYPDIVPRPGLATVDQELATGAFTLLRREVGGGEVRLVTVDGAPTFGRAVEMAPAAVTYGTGLRLEGAGLSNVPAEWGRDLGVALEWRTSPPIERDLTVFLHLVGPDGHRWSQADDPLTDDQMRPASAWPQDGAVVTRHHVPIPAGAPPGQYTLHVGVYDAASGERLPAVVDGAAAEEGVYRLPVNVTRPRFQPSADALDVQVVAMPLADGITWLGYAPDGPVVGGGEARLSLGWRADAEPEQDLRARATVRDETGRVVGQATGELSGLDFPIVDWRAGDVVRGWMSVPLDGRAVAGPGSLSMALVDKAGRVMGDEIRSPLRIDGPGRTYAVEGIDLGRRIDVRLGDAVTLLGVDSERLGGRPGDTVPITLTWRADRLMDEPATVFVHVTNQDGSVLAQADRPPRDGQRPTTSWLAGEVITDPVGIALPTDLPPGTYLVEAGMYSPHTQARLAAVGADGRQIEGDAVKIARLEVRR